MQDMEILKDLFDEKIIVVVNLFMENPEKQFYLTEVSNKTKVNVATTFRILNKLVSQGFIKAEVIGKIRLYKLEKGEKVRALMKLLRTEESPVQEFVDKISVHPRVKKIILEVSENNSAKILVVGDFLPQEKINKVLEEIKNNRNFKIECVEISENQYERFSRSFWNI
jgi:hypothetical protein